MRERNKNKFSLKISFLPEGVNPEMFRDRQKRKEGQKKRKKERKQSFNLCIEKNKSRNRKVKKGNFLIKS